MLARNQLTHDEFDDPRVLRRRRTRRIAALVAGACLLGVVAAAAGVYRILSDRGKIVARVNGEPVYEADVKILLPAGTFESMIRRARQEKIDRICKLVATRQFLKAQHIAVPETEIDRQVEELRRHPPALGCPCCRYASLDQYLASNDLTMDDLRAELRAQSGLDRYAEALWNRTYPTPESVKRMVDSRRADVTQDYAHVWHIFFNTFQQIGQAGDPYEVEKRERDKAVAAWERIDRGEPFDKVAREVSEDQISRPKGGDLGEIPKNAYGPKFASTLSELKPGQIGGPIQTPYGFHIVKWEPIGDDVLLSLCKREFAKEKDRELVSQVTHAAKIERS